MGLMGLIGLIGLMGLMGLDEALGHGEVEGGGNLDVLAATLNQRDLLAQGFHYRGIVGECLGVGLAVCALKQLNIEDLRCLHQTVLVAGNGV